MMSVPSLSVFDPTQFFHRPSTGSNQTCGTGNCRVDTQVQGVAISNDLTGRLIVTTAEGDKITLSANLEADFRSVNYQSHAEANGASVDANAQAVKYSLKRELNITVEGDLNQDEIKDLAKLFRKVSTIFQKYFGGQDDQALAKTAKLADGFDHYSTLAGLDFAVDVQRSVTAVAAQLTTASVVSQATDQTTTNSNTETGTQGVAPSTEAAIPPPSSGTTAPTQPSVSEPTTNRPETVHAAAPAADDKKPASLVEQVLEAVRDAKVESGKLRKYLPRLLDKVREDLQKEPKGPSDTASQQPRDLPPQGASTALFAYQSADHTSVALSIHT